METVPAGRHHRHCRSPRPPGAVCRAQPERDGLQHPLPAMPGYVPYVPRDDTRADLQAPLALRELPATIRKPWNEIPEEPRRQADIPAGLARATDAGAHTERVGSMTSEEALDEAVELIYELRNKANPEPGDRKRWSRTLQEILRAQQENQGTKPAY